LNRVSGGEHDSAVGSKQQSTTRQTKKSQSRVPAAPSVQFHSVSSINLISEDEMEERFNAQSDLWYTRDELMSQRKVDCQRLVNFLKTLKRRQQQQQQQQEHHQQEQQQQEQQGQNQQQEQQGQDQQQEQQGQQEYRQQHQQEDIDDDEYYMRGLEIVLFKNQRAQSKHRAAQAVFSEQERHKPPAGRPTSSSLHHDRSTESTATDDHGPLSLLCQHSLLKVEREKRSEGESSSSSSSASLSMAHSSSRDESEDGGTDEAAEEQGRLRSLERRISERYCMATFTCRDEAYLRGLQDAQVARCIFLDSTK
jgi:hypothetical protein